MSANDRCHEVQAAIPLLFSGAIDEGGRRPLLDHLLRCDECRQVFRQERTLFGMATSGSTSNPLAEHPDLAELELFADERNKLTTDAAQAIETHLSGCKLCSELVTRFRSLPFQLDDLIAAEELPLVASLESSPVTRAETKRIKLFGLLPVRWTLALASAAAIVLISLATLPLMTDRPNLEWELAVKGETVQLVAGLRSDASVLEVTERDGQINVACYFDAFFDEETYFLELRSETETLLETRITKGDFTPETGVTVRLYSGSLEPGDYNLRLVVRTADGLTIISEAVYPFTLSR